VGTMEMTVICIEVKEKGSLLAPLSPLGTQLVLVSTMSLKNFSSRESFHFFI
jgi:hypothetical protein